MKKIQHDVNMTKTWWRHDENMVSDSYDWWWVRFYVAETAAGGAGCVSMGSVEAFESPPSPPVNHITQILVIIKHPKTYLQLKVSVFYD